MANNENAFTKALNFEIPKDKIETIKDKSNGSRPLSYVSWAYAWGMFKQLYPDAQYEIVRNPNTQMPYFSDPEAGIMVFTKITANGETHEMFLFVMDGANNALKFTSYEYQKFNSYTKQYETKVVKAASMFDINKTLMRCLVKNMAIFGFGLNIYNGDDLPDFNLEAEPKEEAPKAAAPTKRTFTPRSQQQPQPQYDPYANVRQALSSVTDINSLMAVYQQYKSLVDTDPNVKSMFSQARINLNKVA